VDEAQVLAQVLHEAGEIVEWHTMPEPPMATAPEESLTHDPLDGAV
jgi:hypothetical protein